MPQLNALPINIPQGVEILEENSSLASTTSGEGFSQLIDQHMASNQGHTNREKPSSAQQPVENKGLEQAGEANGNEAERELTSEDSKSKQQDIAASGKNAQTNKEINSEKNTSEESTESKAVLASDQLMSFFQKADGALQKSNLSAEQLAGFSDKDKALYEQQIQLHNQRILKETTGVAQLISGQSFEQTIAQSNGQLVTNEKLTLSSLSERINVDKNIAHLPVEPIIKGELTGDGLIDNDIEKSALLLTKQMSTSAISSKAGALESTTNPTMQINNPQLGSDNVDAQLSLGEQSLAENSDDESIEQSLVQQKLSAKALAEEKLVSDNGKLSPTNTEEKLAAELQLKQIEPNKVSQTTNNNKPNDVSSTVSDVAAQFKQSISAFEKKVSELAQAKSTSTEQNSSDASEKQTAKAMSAEQVVPSQIGNSQAGTNQPEVGGKVGEQVNTQNVVQSANKPIASVSAAQTQVNAEQINQTQKLEQQQQSSIETLVEENSEEMISLSKGKNELGDKVDEKSAQQLKASLSANASFTDVSARATQVASQAAAQHAIEQLNPTVTSEATQSQKTNAQLHQETISIFRKDFSDAVKDKVMLMISQKLQQFDIKLDPPELGNMQVRVNLQSEQAAVNFVVQNQQAKEALEQNMHKLRDMLAQQGVDVGDANVEQQSQQSGSEEFADNATSQQTEDTASANDAVEHTLSAQVINASANAVDYYA